MDNQMEKKMEHVMEKKMEHVMETGVICGLLRAANIP